jgi:type VI secretion system protein ImpL
MTGFIVALLAGSILWLLRAEWLPYSLAKALNTPSLDSWLVAVFILLFATILIRVWIQRRAPQKLDSEGITAPPLSEEERQAQPQYLINRDELKRHLQRDSRWRWKHRHAWLLLTGTPSQVEQVAPGLTSQGWLRCGNAILLWGGDIIQEGNQPDLKALRAMRGRRPVDALVHVADDTVQSASRIDALQRGLWSVQHALRWQPPVYRLEVTKTQWPQEITAHPLVAALSGPAFTVTQLRTLLAALADNMVTPGMQYVMQNTRHDYLLRLSSQLKHGGVERLLNLYRVFQDDARSFRLHGVLFTPPLVNDDTGFLYQQRMGAVWRGIAGHSARQPGKSATLDPRTVMLWCLEALLALWATGMVVSWCGNISLLHHTQALLSASSLKNEQQLGALQAQLRTLAEQQQTGTPWYRRFGLDISGRLPPYLWPELSARPGRK